MDFPHPTPHDAVEPLTAEELDRLRLKLFGTLKLPDLVAQTVTDLRTMIATKKLTPTHIIVPDSELHRSLGALVARELELEIIFHAWLPDNSTWLLVEKPAHEPYLQPFRMP